MPVSRVRGVHFVNDELFELTTERDALAFLPGDCLALSNDAGVTRPYSIASGVGESCLRFLIRHMPGGDVTGWLAALEPGDEVRISDPFGWFRPGPHEDPEGDSVFVATGTGISPFLSALRSFPELKRVLCLYGVRYLADAVQLAYLQARTTLRLAVSREDAPPHHHGRVTDLLPALPLTAGTHYYLCGLDAMIDAFSAWLAQHDVPFTQIHREVFFNA